MAVRIKNRVDQVLCTTGTLKDLVPWRFNFFLYWLGTESTGSFDNTNGAFPLRGTTRLRVRLAFPLQFSTTLEWAGLFTCRYSRAASTAVTPEKRFNSTSLHQALTGSAPRLSTRCTSSTDKETAIFGLFKKGRSFKTVAFNPSLAVLI